MQLRSLTVAEQEVTARQLWHQMFKACQGRGGGSTTSITIRRAAQCRPRRTFPLRISPAASARVEFAYTLGCLCWQRHVAFGAWANSDIGAINWKGVRKSGVASR